MTAVWRARWFRLLLIALLAFATAGSFSAGAAAVAGGGSRDDSSRDAADSSSRDCRDFGRAAEGADSHELFDETTGRLEVATEGRRFVLLEADAGCLANPRAAKRLAQARIMAVQNRTSLCDSFRQAVVENRTQERGVDVNLDAARRYLANECN